MNPQTLSQQLKSLRLRTAADELEQVLTKHKSAVSLAWAVELMERELDARKERLLQGRIKSAQFPETPSLESFDWSFDPAIDEAKIRELAQLNFVRDCGIALLLGKPGTGKTHIALALGVLAVHQGFRVYCTSIKRLAQDIKLAQMKNSLDVLFRKILSSELWILDDWGMTTLKQDTSEEVFDLLDRRKHSSAMILTSNRDVAEWSEMFTEPVLASAAIDRVFDRAEIVTFNGPSYRMKGKLSMPEAKI